MDGTGSTRMLLDRLPFVDRFRFDLECLLNRGEHLDQLPDLMKAVLAFFEGVHSEMERYLLETVSDVESDLAAAAMSFAAGRRFARVLDYRNNVRSHIEFLVQERSFPYVIFLVHFLFLTFVG
jgi:hypothetical protein